MALPRNSPISHGASGTSMRILWVSHFRLECHRRNFGARKNTFAGVLSCPKEPLIIESTQVESRVSEAPRAEPERKAEGATRLISLDAFRGMVMVLMLAEHKRLPEVARAFPHRGLWRLIAF